MLLDISPLRRHRDYRLLFLGQVVSALGTFFTYVALPVQIFELTKSSAMVGLLGIIQLVPVAITAVWGGVLADAVDRRQLLRWCEALLMGCSLALATNSLAPHPSVTMLFIVAALMSAISGIHVPALESLTPKLVNREELTAVSALTSFRGTSAAVAGPALAGVCIASWGLPVTFGIDAITYAISLLALTAIRSMPPPDSAPTVSFGNILEGFRYAASRPELIGTYVIDIIAMTFAMPVALLPALAARFGGAHSVGYLYSAMSFGSLLITLFSGWSKHVVRHGAAVVIAATAWGIAITGLGFASTLPVAILCLALAGAADMVSGLFRLTMWNETIPTEIRGRMAGIEQLSYMTGPLLGNARAGFMAERFGLGNAITWGGVACVFGVIACMPLLPVFWTYRRASRDAVRDPGLSATAG